MFAGLVSWSFDEWFSVRGRVNEIFLLRNFCVLWNIFDCLWVSMKVVVCEVHLFIGGLNVGH